MEFQIDNHIGVGKFLPCGGWKMGLKLGPRRIWKVQINK